jgi:hypothetical protein
MLSNDGILLHSTDGGKWQEHKFDGGWLPRWLVWTGQEFVVGNNKASFTSADGLAWKAASFQSAAHVKWTGGACLSIYHRASCR